MERLSEAGTAAVTADRAGGPRARRGLIGLAVAGALALVTTLVVSVALSASGPAVRAADAQDTGRVASFTGHGWGHGRGMGQYGAYGYAADKGWTSAQILSHFYGGTTAGPAPGGGSVNPSAVRVDLRFMIGVPTAVALEQGTILVRGTDGADLGSVATGAVRARWAGDHYELDTGPACAGPWTAIGAVGGGASLRFLASSSAGGSAALLQACGASQRTWYEGELRAEVDGGTAHTVNVAPVDTYLRGVVPNEMPSGWPTAALEAQAVAARSFALAGDSRQQPYADTCDTTLCQVYDGAWTTRGGAFRQANAARSDAAVSATAGLVRLKGGAVARTEFSSSTGGWSAGGTFPAVVDAGDATSINPYHNWSAASVDLTPLEANYGLGHILAITVTSRNGSGADGGRVSQVQLRFERGTASTTGAFVRTLLGLRSDWFTPGAVVDTNLRATAEGQYIDRTYQRLVGRAASDDEIGRWFPSVQRGDRLALTGSIIRNDFYVGRIVDDLYQRALGRAPDADGRAYWIRTIIAGTSVEEVGVLFFGSQEYFLRSGGTNTSFVTALYQGILGRAPDPGGQAYWVNILATRRGGLDDVAAGFYVSLESRRDRAVVIHQEARGVPPSDAGRDALAERLLSADDLVVAAEVAASPEA